MKTVALVICYLAFTGFAGSLVFAVWSASRWVVLSYRHRRGRVGLGVVIDYAFMTAFAIVVAAACSFTIALFGPMTT